jgi:hypothetical protein
VVVVVGLTGLVAGVPPQLSVNHSTVSPPPTVAESTDGWPAQVVSGVASGLVGVAGCGFTVTVTLAQVALTQPVVVFRARA